MITGKWVINNTLQKAGPAGGAEFWTDAIFSALAAAGYAVVPVEPTEAMLLEGNLAAVNSRQSGISGMSIDAQHRNVFHREIACYRAMLAAAGETKE